MENTFCKPKTKQNINSPTSISWNKNASFKGEKKIKEKTHPWLAHSLHALHISYPFLKNVFKRDERKRGVRNRKLYLKIQILKSNSEAYMREKWRKINKYWNFHFKSSPIFVDELGWSLFIFHGIFDSHHHFAKQNTKFCGSPTYFAKQNTSKLKNENARKGNKTLAPFVDPLNICVAVSIWI